MKRLLPIAAALTLSACATTDGDGASSASTTSGADSTSASAPVAAPARTATEYLTMAGASDLYEIQSSQILLQSTQSADLRSFAQMMIDHHAKTTQQLAAAATAAGTPAPAPQLDARRGEMIRALQAASGTARDKLYVTQQVAAHQEALNLHNGYATSGDNPQLQAVATQTVPIIQQHLSEIQRIAGPTG